MDTYLDAQVPEELCKNVFLSFMKKPSPSQTQTSHSNVGKEFHIKDMAAVTASQTVCAPINIGTADMHIEKAEKHHGFAEKLANITERLSHIGSDKGHSRHDSGSGIESGKRSRAGTNY